MGKQRLEMQVKDESEEKPQSKRLDLSIAQVAGSGLAAVIAALLAGKLGVYGTIIGAGVVSVVATTGGTIFQHLFRRTGEQIRDVTVLAKPKARQVPVADTDSDHWSRGAAGDEQATTMLPAVGQEQGQDRGDDADPDRTQLLKQAEATQMLPRVEATQMLPRAEDSTRLLRQAQGGDPASGPAAGSEEFTSATTHGTRLRRWKSPLLHAILIFVLAMVTVTVVELATGSTPDGKSGTTFQQLFRSNDSGNHAPVTPSGTPGTGHSSEGGTSGDGSTQSPGADQSGGGSGSGDKPSPHSTPSNPAGGDGSTPTQQPTPTPSQSQGGSDQGGADGGTGSGKDKDKGKGGGQTDGKPGSGNQNPDPGAQQNDAAAAGAQGAGSGSDS
ncbi:hypothetical protein AB0I49_00410 [Streptomyces sp. NPDC050617]|uniref:hypothetical protein n=1 Tax=Streptomyces sp. NPDC050617 TaxID=3154628 RepID=UPI00343030A3